MRRFVDLHTHSTASDGGLSPRELIRLADAKRLAAVALTDHDTTAGLAEAAEEARSYPLLRFVPGVEVSAQFPKGTLHILGLGIDAGAPLLGRLIARLRAARDERNPRIVAALQAMGHPIEMADVLAVAGDRGRSASARVRPDNRGRGPYGQAARAAEETEEARGQAQRAPAGDARGTQGRDALATLTVGRVHIAEALRRKGCVKTVAEAFDRLIGLGGPAYVDKERIAPREAIRAITESGGAAVLAHPPQLRYENLAQLERIVRGLTAEGLAAIEAYHSDHTPEQTRHYMKLARRLGIGVTGGSDFHAAPKPDVRLGRPPVPLAAIEGPLRRIVMGE